MKYVRTKDGRIICITDKGCIKESCGRMYAFVDKTLAHHLQNGVEIVKQADTIEELMMIGDLVFKTNGDIFVIPNQAYIDYYIKHKSVSKLFIEDSKGNYIKVAQKSEKSGELELL